MADATVSRLGQINGAGDTDALFLKVFSGEVMTSFEQNTVMMGRHQVRTISNGKSAQFPVMGRASAEYHTPGAEITGGTLKHAERVITIDDLLIAPQFISNIDEAKNHYDVRSVYSTEMGRKLGQTMDKHLLQLGCLAARDTKTIDDSDQNGGTQLSTGATTAPTGDTLADMAFDSAQIFDEKDVPEDERFLFVRPQEFYAMARSTKILNRDWGGEGSYAGGNVIRVAGLTIVKTNNLPSTNVGAGTLQAGTGDKYAGDFSKTVGLMMHPSAIGTVKLLDLGLESEYQINRQGTLLVAKYAVGHGILRPESAIELVTA
ncbi:phage capsid protein [Litchfieldella qijiaojingensis]|uniref:Phage capsid protein n=1 Tax=Litchfieldella qijiaojingensis TaxID=980347 RepID=A0ABQ2YPQ2_9GAMM|nr:phage capsid protein [Halomonas qijiaojingensis]GGX91169.1 phage capsid protein [Halomonas qijiaojingensis]